MWLLEILVDLVVGVAEWRDHRADPAQRSLPGRTVVRSLLAGATVALSLLGGFAWGVASWGGGVGDGVPLLLPISGVGAALLFAGAAASRNDDGSTFGRPPTTEARRRTLRRAVGGVLLSAFAVGVALGMTRV